MRANAASKPVANRRSEKSGNNESRSADLQSAYREESGMKGEIVVALAEDGRTPMVRSRCAILKPDREALLS